LIPIRDENPSGTIPFVTLALIAANVAVFLVEMSVGLERAVWQYGLIPARVLPSPGIEVTFDPGLAPADPWLTVFAAMFMHGGLMHLIGNMWFLWLFGDNIEDRLGHVGFVVFYLVCGLGASAAHVLVMGRGNPSLAVPMVGASGAIAGVLGAYLICFPRARVLTIVPFFFLFFTRLPAGLFLLLWLAAQVSGVLSPERTGIAWWAHIGGFVLGAALVLVWPKSKRARQDSYEAVPDAWRAKWRDGG
jgi:hypothetical protein